MAGIIVLGDQLSFQGKNYRCAYGKSGFMDNKRESDGCTPLGVFPLRACWYRADRLRAPQTLLPLRPITEQDAWCDDPESAEYNRAVTLPFAPRHERLWREDHVYDLIVPLGYNDSPAVPGKGSAIFLHIARDDYAPTEGCIALKGEDLMEVLCCLTRETCMEIAKSDFSCG